MKLVIVTGMSGAGKSSVLKMLEDAGYFCVDNLPIQLVRKFTKLITQGNNDRVALGLDIRSGLMPDELEGAFKDMRRNGLKYEILFLECSSEVLIKRYKETRRVHPLSRTGRIDRGIEQERERLAFLKKQANVIIDTSRLLIRDLREQIYKIYVDEEKFSNFFITILSFGFKYGIPADADLVFDVRFLPNPHYVPKLKNKTGKDKEVADYVMDSPSAVEFLNKLEDMLLFLIPQYIKEGKNQLVIGIGCTGGKHRSVTLADELFAGLKNKDYGIKVEHRDIEKNE